MPSDTKRSLHNTSLKKVRRRTDGLHSRTSTVAVAVAVAVVPQTVSPDYAAEVVTDLCRSRSELRLLREEAGRRKSAARCPLAGLDAAAIAGFASGENERIALVQAAATITRKDLQTWEGVDEIRRSRQKNEELRRDIERKVERLPEYIEKIPRTFRAFVETCFGWRTRIQQTMPRVSPTEESVSSLAGDLEEAPRRSS